MPRTGPGHGLKLPHALREELGLDEQIPNRKGIRANGGRRTRKEERKADRLEKKEHRKRDSVHVDSSQRSKQNGYRNVNSTQISTEQKSQRKPASKLATKSDPDFITKRPKSILKNTHRHASPSASESSTSSRQLSPGLVLNASSKAFKDRAAEEDAEIARLEKKLGKKNKATSKSPEDDGLTDLLDGLDDENQGLKRVRDDKDWLQNKRRKVRVVSKDYAENNDASDSEDELLENYSGLDEETDEGLEDDTDDSDVVNVEDTGNQSEDELLLEDDAASDFADFENGSKPTVPEQTKRTRENPYLPPVTTDNRTTTKYIPPSLRNPNPTDDQSLERLKRQIQGHLNRLSEANLITILSAIEKLYESTSRQEVSSMLIDLLLSLFCDPSALQNTFVILHAAFIAAVYKIVGTAFGAQILSELIERFDEYHKREVTGKESLNLISLLASLFTFHVIGSNVVCDYIKLLLEDLNEVNTELLLRVIRDCGPQLRQDDPTALKTIVQMVQSSAKRYSDSGKKMSVRTQFMIETMTDLKNNKFKGATNAAGVSGEHITRMRKVLGSLGNRNIKASEPLRVNRDDIKNSDKMGKWWLVGSSWKGNENGHDETTLEEPSTAIQADSASENEETDLFTLSRQYQMNTDIRRSIFVAMMSANDFQDAHMRILKLRLKRSQEAEIPKVLLRCAGAEAAFNPYYALVAKRLCSEKSLRKNFEFALWSFFKRIGQGSGGDSDDEFDGHINSKGDKSIDVHEITNLAKLYGFLVSEGCLNLSILKVLDLLYLKEQAQIFVELLVITIILTPPSSTSTYSDNKIQSIFEKGANDAPQLIKRLQYFIKKHLKDSDLVADSDRERLKQGCKLAIQTLGRTRT